MQVWRLVTRDFAAKAYSGEGSRLAPARWNERGVPIAYSAEHLSLAVLEVLVHLNQPERPLLMAAVPAVVPDGLIEALDEDELPPNWREADGIERLQQLGGAWMRSARSLGYLVPSAVVPQEHLLLINPEHPRVSEMVVGEPLPFRFDERLLGVELSSG